MTELPFLIRRSPQLFYVAGFVMLVWSFGNFYADMTINNVQLNAQLSDMASYASLLKSKALFEAMRETLWYVSSGVMFRIMIAIFDKVKGA